MGLSSTDPKPQQPSSLDPEHPPIPPPPPADSSNWPFILRKQEVGFRAEVGTRIHPLEPFRGSCKDPHSLKLLSKDLPPKP